MRSIKLIIIFCALGLMFLSACSTKKIETQTDVTKDKQEESTSLLPSSNADIDLVNLSANMIYAEVYDMLSYPQEYDGKTVRLSGLFSAVYESVEDNDLRFSCIIPDATACCAQGIEFVPKSDLVFPDDFPIDNTRIVVTGTLKTGEKDLPIYISDAEIQY